jgi:hypothetical protein
MDARDVAATATLFDVLPGHGPLPEGGVECLEEVLFRVPEVAVGDEVDVVVRCGMLDGVDGLLDDEVLVVGVLWFLQVRRLGAVVDVVGHRFGVVVVCVVV